MKKKMNRVLAEFAGFKVEGNTTLYYVSPAGEPCDPPDFFDPIQGLGLLFKWVVPELIRKYPMSTIHIEYGIFNEVEEDDDVIVWFTSPYKDKPLVECRGANSTEALATACYNLVKD